MQRIRLRARRFPMRLAGIASAATLILLIPLSVHCYNVLIRRYYDALAAHARVEVLLQRRDDLTRNLERVVSAVRTHEATLFADVTTKRANAHDGAPKSTPTPMGMGMLPLDRLLAVSEQYPVERLSEDVQPVTQALVEVERDLGIARQRSVEATNMYLHRVHTFPGNLYAWVFGFRALPFFEAAPEAGRLRPGQF
jgi:LemA protein